MILAAIKVSLIALAVIFIVLGSLIGVIKLLVAAIPYKAPPPKPSRARSSQSSSTSEEELEHLAAIHAVMPHHLGLRPEDVRIGNIRPQ